MENCDTEKKSGEGGLIETGCVEMPCTVFYSSDGHRFRSYMKAFKYESYNRFLKLLPESAFGYSFKYGQCPGYYISKHTYIKCGVYRITLNSSHDLTVVEHFFKGIIDELDEITDSDYPYEFDIEIYYEEFPNILIQRGAWRLYREDDHR